MIGFASVGITYDIPPEINYISENYSEEYKINEVDKINSDSILYLSENDIKKFTKLPIIESGISAEQKQLLEKQKNHLKEIMIAGDSWSEENIPGPNSKVITRVEYIINELANYYIFSDRITQTVEEGICMVFFHADKTMFFEIYNDGELGYIIEDRINKRILRNENVININESIKKISSFFHLNYEISKTTYKKGEEYYT